MGPICPPRRLRQSSDCQPDNWNGCSCAMWAQAPRSTSRLCGSSARGTCCSKQICASLMSRWLAGSHRPATFQNFTANIGAYPQMLSGAHRRPEALRSLAYHARLRQRPRFVVVTNALSASTKWQRKKCSIRVQRPTCACKFQCSSPSLKQVAPQVLL